MSAANMRSAVVCAALWAATQAAVAGSVTVEVIDREGRPTADAVVVLTPANRATSPKTAWPMQATVLQQNMRFVPAVSLVAVGATVRFINNDPWDHHVRGSAAGATQFDASQSGGFEMRLEGKTEGKPPKSMDVTLDQPGVVGATLLGCFIHGSMRGNVFVSDSPWAAKTSIEGQAKFDDVPAGPSQLRVWQADQLINLPLQTIMVGDAPQTIKVQLQVVARGRRI